MTATRHSVHELHDLFDQFQRMFGRSAAQPAARGHEAVFTADWSPAVDVSESKDGYLIQVELPEVRKDQVKVNVNADVLVIQGERTFPKEEGRKYHRVERSYGTFARSFSLPEDVESDGIRAEHKEGMLYVVMPKVKQPKPKSIEIQVG